MRRLSPTLHCHVPRLLLLLIVTALGCTSTRFPMIHRSRIVPSCVPPDPSLASEIVDIVMPSLLIAGVVASGYAAMGGENPFR